MADRASNGHFLKGHAPTFFHHKPGTIVGRPKEVKTRVKDALSVVEDSMPDIIAAELACALDPTNKDCHDARKYLMDRIYGRAKERVRLEGELTIESLVRRVVDQVS